jgi:hypothetical protein
MLRLTHAGHPVFLSPEHIISIVPVVVTNVVHGCDVRTLEPGSFSGSYRVEETAADVCRLKAAWERRYTVPEIVDNGDLPIFMWVVPETGINVACCDYTRKLREARPNKPRGSRPGRKG